MNDISRLTNMVKFTLDGHTLHLPSAKADDPLSNRVVALRQYLTDAFGSEAMFARVHQELLAIQESDLDDDAADAELVLLERRCGKKARFVDLVVQLIVCETMLQSS